MTKRNILKPKLYTDCPPEKSTIEKWFAKFKRVDVDTLDDAEQNKIGPDN